MRIEITPQEMKNLYGVLKYHGLSLLPNLPNNLQRFCLDVTLETLSMYERWCERYLSFHCLTDKGKLTKQGHVIQELLDKLHKVTDTPDNTMSLSSIAFLVCKQKAVEKSTCLPI